MRSSREKALPLLSSGVSSKAGPEWRIYSGSVLVIVVRSSFSEDCTASARDDVPCGFDARFTFSIGLWRARGLVVFRVLFMNSSFPCL